MKFSKKLLCALLSASMLLSLCDLPALAAWVKLDYDGDTVTAQIMEGENGDTLVSAVYDAGTGQMKRVKTGNNAASTPWDGESEELKLMVLDEDRAPAAEAYRAASATEGGTVGGEYGLLTVNCDVTVDGGLRILRGGLLQIDQGRLDVSGAGFCLEPDAELRIGAEGGFFSQDGSSGVIVAAGRVIAEGGFDPGDWSSWLSGGYDAEGDPIGEIYHYMDSDEFAREIARKNILPPVENEDALTSTSTPYADTEGWSSHFDPDGRDDDEWAIRGYARLIDAGIADFKANAGGRPADAKDVQGWLAAIAKHELEAYETSPDAAALRDFVNSLYDSGRDARMYGSWFRGQHTETVQDENGGDVEAIRYDWDHEFYHVTEDFATLLWLASPKSVSDITKITVTALGEAEEEHPDGSKPTFSGLHYAGIEFTGPVEIVIADSARSNNLQFDNCAFDQGVTVNAPAGRSGDDGQFMVLFHDNCTVDGTLTVVEAEADAKGRKGLTDWARTEELGYLIYQNTLHLSGVKGMDITGSARYSADTHDGRNSFTIAGVTIAGSGDRDRGFGVDLNWNGDWDGKSEIAFTPCLTVNGEGYWHDDDADTANGARVNNLDESLTLSGRFDGKLRVGGVVDARDVSATGRIEVTGDECAYIKLANNTVYVNESIRGEQFFETEGKAIVERNDAAQIVVNGTRIDFAHVDLNGDHFWISFGTNTLTEDAISLSLPAEEGKWEQIPFRAEIGSGDAERWTDLHRTEDGDARWIDWSDCGNVRLTLTLSGGAVVEYDPLATSWSRAVTLDEFADRLRGMLRDNGYPGSADFELTDDDLSALDALWPEERGYQWAGNEPWGGVDTRADLAFLTRYAGAALGVYGDPGEYVYYAAVTRDGATYDSTVLTVLKNVYDAIWDGKDGKTAFETAGISLDKDGNYQVLENADLDTLLDRLLAALPRSAFEGDAVFTLVRDGDGEHVNGEKNVNTISGKAFAGKVTIQNGSTPQRDADGNYDDNGGSIRFVNCSFAEDVEIVLNGGFWYGVTIDDSCSFAPGASVTFSGQGERHVWLSLPDGTTVNGVKIEYSGLAREEFDVDLMTWGNSKDGWRRVLQIGTDGEREQYDQLTLSGSGYADILNVCGYVDVSGVAFAEGGELRQWAGWQRDRSVINVGGNTLYVGEQSSGNQFYAIDSAGAVVFENNPNVNAFINSGENGWRIGGATVDRWGSSFNIHLDLSYDAGDSIKLYFGDTQIPEEYYTVNEEDGGTRIDPTFADGWEDYWPADDDVGAAHGFSLEVTRNGATAAFRPIAYSGDLTADLIGFTDTLLRVASRYTHSYDGTYVFRNSEGDIDNSAYPEIDETLAEDLSAIWPEERGYRWTGNDPWGDPFARRMLAFAAANGGGTVTSENYGDPNAPIRYDTALALASAVYREIMGQDKTLPASVAIGDWTLPGSAENGISNDGKDDLLWNRLDRALNAAEDVEGFLKALARVKEQGGDVDVTGSFDLTTGKLEPLAKAYGSVLTGSGADGYTVTVPAPVSLNIAGGARLGVGTGVTLALPDGGFIDAEHDEPGGYTVTAGESGYRLRADEWGNIYVNSYGSHIQIDNNGELGVDGALYVGKNSSLNNDGTLTVGADGRLTLGGGEPLGVRGYADFGENGIARFTPGDWDDARGGNGWVDVVACAGLDNNGTLNVYGKADSGTYSYISNNAWHDDDARYYATVNVGSGAAVTLGGSFFNNSDSIMDGYVKRSLAELTISGTVTLADGDENYDAELNNHGDITIKGGGKLSVGAYKSIRNSAWTDEETGLPYYGEINVEENGTLELNTADLYNDADGEAAAALNVSGAVKLGSPKANSAGDIWVSYLSNDGAVSVRSTGSVTVDSGVIVSCGSWIQDGSLALKSETVEEETVEGRFELMYADGATLEVTGSITISGGEFLVVESEGFDQQDEPNGTVTKQDVPDAPADAVYAVRVWTAEALLAAKEQGFGECIVRGDIELGGGSSAEFTYVNVWATLVLGDGATLTVHGALNNNSLIIIEPGGTLTVEGKVYNNGTIDVREGGTYDPMGGSDGSGGVVRSKYVSTQDELKAALNDTSVNSILISGSITLTEDLTFPKNVSIRNGASLTVPEGGTLTLEAKCIYLAVEKGGTLTVNGGLVMEGLDEISQDNIWDPASNVFNSGTLTVNGTAVIGHYCDLNNLPGGTLTLNGTVTGADLFENSQSIQECGEIQNRGETTIGGSVSVGMYGNYDVEEAAVTTTVTETGSLTVKYAFLNEPGCTFRTRVGGTLTTEQGCDVSDRGESITVVASQPDMDALLNSGVKPMQIDLAASVTLSGNVDLDGAILNLTDHATLTVASGAKVKAMLIDVNDGTGLTVQGELELTGYVWTWTDASGGEHADPRRTMSNTVSPVIKDAGSVTVDGGKILSHGVIGLTNSAFTVENGGSVVIDEGGYFNDGTTILDGGTLDVTGTFTLAGYMDGWNWFYPDGTLELKNDGELIVNSMRFPSEETEFEVSDGTQFAALMNAAAAGIDIERVTYSGEGPLDIQEDVTIPAGVTVVVTPSVALTGSLTVKGALETGYVFFQIGADTDGAGNSIPGTGWAEGGALIVDGGTVTVTELAHFVNDVTVTNRGTMTAKHFAIGRGTLTVAGEGALSVAEAFKLWVEQPQIYFREDAEDVEIDGGTVTWNEVGYTDAETLTAALKAADET